MIAALLATLHIMTHNGAIYDVVEDIPAGSCLIGGTETLVYEASTFNTCQEIRLKPGCYRVEMMGGLGGKNEECKDWAEQMITDPLSGMFTLETETTVYAFRGGDGMPGTVNKSGSYYGSFGGGASGADSIVVVGDRVFRARGANGQSCYRGPATYPLCQNIINTSIGTSMGTGAGYQETNTPRNLRACILNGNYGSADKYYWNLGGGGGGAPSGTGGTTWQSNKNCPSDTVVSAGTDATNAGGGDGGGVTDAYYKPGDTTPKNAAGGRGGANVTFQCGGQTITIYGGGGGGACISGYYGAGVAVPGGDGGSGSTNTSTNSFIRIYKM